VRDKFAAAYTFLVLFTSNSDKKSIAEGLAAGAAVLAAAESWS